jgi:hypothetical protein
VNKGIRKLVTLFLAAIITVGCSNSNKHANVKVKALHGWEPGRAKSCMLLTGRSVIQGGKAGPDPKEMRCTDQRKTDPDEMNWDYVRISNVIVDEVSEKQFNNSEKWGVPMLCQELSASELKCVFDGTE